MKLSKKAFKRAQVILNGMVVLAMLVQPVSSPSLLMAMAADEPADEAISAPAPAPKEEPKVEPAAPSVQEETSAPADESSASTISGTDSNTSQDTAETGTDATTDTPPIIRRQRIRQAHRKPTHPLLEIPPQQLLIQLWIIQPLLTPSRKQA